MSQCAGSSNCRRRNRNCRLSGVPGPRHPRARPTSSSGPAVCSGLRSGNVPRGTFRGLNRAALPWSSVASSSPSSVSSTASTRWLVRPIIRTCACSKSGKPNSPTSLTSDRRGRRSFGAGRGTVGVELADVGDDHEVAVGTDLELGDGEQDLVILGHQRLDVWPKLRPGGGWGRRGRSPTSRSLGRPTPRRSGTAVGPGRISRSRCRRGGGRAAGCGRRSPGWRARRPF